MKKEFREYLKQVLSKTLYFAAQERFDKAAVKAPQLIEDGRTTYLKEAWRLADKYGESSVRELEKMGIRSPEDMATQHFKPLVESKLKDVQTQMERELSPSKSSS